MLLRTFARNPGLSRVLIATLCGLLIAANLLIWQALTNAEKQQAKSRLKLETHALALQLEARFESQASSLRRLANRWPYHHDDYQQWLLDVERLLDDVGNYQAIEWLDADYRMQWIEPLAGNEAVIGFEYPLDHPNYPFLERVRGSSEPELSDSFELQQGGPGLAYYVPVYREIDGQKRFDGFLLAVFRVEVLLEDLLRDLAEERLSLVFYDQRAELFNRQRPDALELDWAVESQVVLGGNSGFVLRSKPTRQLLQETTTRLPAMILGAGLLASFSLCLALWLAMLSGQRSQQLKQSNQSLQREVVRRQATEERMQQQSARLKLILDLTDHSHDALFIIGLDPQELIYMNRACWQTLGYDQKELASILAIAPEDVMPDYQAWADLLQQQVESQGNAIYQQNARHRNGDLIPMEISVSYLQRYGRDHLICVGRNNSVQLAVTHRLEALSNQDGLTGLFNRRYFDETLHSEWRRMRRGSEPLGLLMLDVDHFKPFNDQLGHQAGDEALQKLAVALRENLLREGDCACRYGGEEFAVILPGADLEQCERVAHHLHQAVQDLHISHPETEIKYLTISIGAASLIPDADNSPHDLVQIADRMLYQAKSSGRNRTCSADQAAS
ncbi:diguanylate cyclase [Halopseudomonas salegens]|uniref:diguanylate cyclase n=1 Tax=Halopseudomonas salegens TaxID=1434072 RepID=A0A1H2H2F6_9GAMM|nr:diguanylate cyclase [Halopseudomonas salegens]SDU26006.1 PAS domain S-box-containing protein/diguanylate cyclase (GGDEF) domain-containing protein [Halopseudomonas salegens]